MTKPRKTSASAIDAAASLLAGGSAAFLFFAMPEPVLARIFEAVRLASFSPKFQPPFGAGLRWGLVVAAGVVVFAFVWSLMKALDRAPAGARPQPAQKPAPEPDAPRLRKADAHPDAPARRPLLAGRELGEPLDLGPADVLPDDPAAAAYEPAEQFLPQPGAFPFPAEALASLPSFLVPQEPEPAPAPFVRPAPEPEPEPAPVARVAPEPETDADPEADSIGSLMRRFETGLGRKKQALADRTIVDPVPPPPAPPVAEPNPAPQIPAPVGHRLRSAISGLQKAAGN